MRVQYHITIEGAVQGVGFRPFVLREAVAHQLSGYVMNTSCGVCIVAEGESRDLHSFMNQIYAHPPQNAMIAHFQSAQGAVQGFEGFVIRPSELGVGLEKLTTAIPSDVSICAECLQELRDPTNRRYRYPFINCVNCGPRYSMIHSIPYDRPNTSMNVFAMCSVCELEYTDPANRRYHAQPISCPACGPRLSLYNSKGDQLLEGLEALAYSATLIHQGKIIALKGMGGFHLVCDARQAHAVMALRRYKHRPKKPFAVMFDTLDSIRTHCATTTDEESVIQSPAHPIVLLKQRSNVINLSLDAIAPQIHRIGVFLPYTPIHVLLMEYLQCPVVVTSANRSGSPIIADSKSLRQTFEGVVECYLDYDRVIVNACDDSVARVHDGNIQIIRKARGYAPHYLTLPISLQHTTLAVGGHLNNSLALGYNNRVLMSPYVGDFSGVETLECFEKMVKYLCEVHRFVPEVIVCDKHPAYESTRWARRQTTPVLEVQHHYAHLLALMAEHHLSAPLLGIAWDGTGYGDDGTLWGGEFFHITQSGYRRLYHFKPLKLLGGEKAIREPRRIALSILFDLYGKEALRLSCPTIEAFSSEEREILYAMHCESLSSPLCSSVGRLFDAVASLCDVIQLSSYEGESGLKIESLCVESAIKEGYPYRIDQGIIDLSPAFHAMLLESNRVVALSQFIATLRAIVAQIAQEVQLPVGLSGGVFQNGVLVDAIQKTLRHNQIPCYTHQIIPCNDSGIALGQIMYAGLPRR
jgi:hydrogenase maturation protein HypF